jgi:hypothetical protein
VDKLTPDFLLQLVVVIATAASVYAAIKSDLRVLHEKIRNTNHRIDEMRDSHRRRVGDTSDSEF